MEKERYIKMQKALRSFGSFYQMLAWDLHENGVSYSDWHEIAVNPKTKMLDWDGAIAINIYNELKDIQENSDIKGLQEAKKFRIRKADDNYIF